MVKCLRDKVSVKKWPVIKWPVIKCPVTKKKTDLLPKDAKTRVSEESLLKLYSTKKNETEQRIS